MVQKDMDWNVFLEIVKDVQQGDQVSLQGEGEPTLWPHFEEAVLYLKSKKAIIYSIVNGTKLDTKLISENFSYIGISLDSLDEEHCNELGRHYLPKVLRNLVELKKYMPTHRTNIHTTDYGQDLTDLKRFIVKEKYIHYIQKLQVKEDYVRNYNGIIEKPVLFYKNKTSPQQCDFLTYPKLRFFTIDAVELPCCLIKDSKGWPGSKSVKESIEKGDIVSWCLGCRNLKNLRIEDIN